MKTSKPPKTGCYGNLANITLNTDGVCVCVPPTPTGGPESGCGLSPPQRSNLSFPTAPEGNSKRDTPCQPMCVEVFFKTANQRLIRLTKGERVKRPALTLFIEEEGRSERSLL